MANFQPAVKWCGSKRSQAEEIVKEMPERVGTYYEPFCGGCSILRAVIESGIEVKRYEASDRNEDLISLWQRIKERPAELSNGYGELWQEMVLLDDKEKKKLYYGKVRERYNRERDPRDFLFIMRTCMNGMPRYNNQGAFNNSFHVTRDGIRPETLEKVLSEWSGLLREKDVSFRTRDYRDVKTRTGDFLYLDPPYANTKGIYHGGIDLSELWGWLGVQRADYLLSFDGKSGDVDNTYEVPGSLYSEHKYIRSGNSSFKRLVGKSKDSVVFESLYKK